MDGKWKPLVLRAMSRGPARYSELKRQVPGISDKMLIQSLKELESDQVVSRKDFQEIPPRVEYSMTPFGDSLMRAMGPICAWGAEHMQKISRIKGRNAPEEVAVGA